MMDSSEHYQIKTRGSFKVATRDTRDDSVVREKCFSQNNTVTAAGRHWVANCETLDFRGRNTGHTVSRRATYYNHVVGLGTGTSEIVESDTDLGGTVNRKEARSITGSGPIFDWENKLVTCEVKRRVIYTPGEATGTWGQVGFWGWVSRNTPDPDLTAGQALRDSAGELTTVTFTEFEEVTIYYSLFITVPIGDAIEEGYTFDVVPPLDHMTVLKTDTKTIKDNQHTVNIGRASTFCPGFGGLYAEYLNGYSSNSTYFMAIKSTETSRDGELVVYYKQPDDVEYSTVEYSVHQLENKPAPFTVEHEQVDYGKLYRYKIAFSLPYHVMNDVEIKAIGFMADSHTDDSSVPWGSGAYYQNRFNNSRYRMPIGVVSFEPAVFKGDGDEFQIEFYVYYEVS